MFTVTHYASMHTPMLSFTSSKEEVGYGCTRNRRSTPNIKIKNPTSYINLFSSEGNMCIIGPTIKAKFYGGYEDTCIESILTSKRYVGIEKELERQHSDLHEGKDWNSLKREIYISLFPLLRMNPDAINAFLTDDNSIYYSLSIDGRSFYFQHFFLSEEEEENAFLSIFIGKNNVSNISGTVAEMLEVIARDHNMNRTRIYYARLDGISY